MNIMEFIKTSNDKKAVDLATALVKFAELEDSFAVSIIFTRFCNLGYDLEYNN